MLPVIALSVLLACARNAPQDTLKPDGPIARRIDALFWPVFWIAVAIFVIVEGALLVFVIRYRDRGGDGEAPRQVHGHTRLEILWTAIPTLILIGVAVVTVKTIFALSHKPTGDIVEVKVTAHQWWWAYDYPKLGVVTANELHIPAGKPVFITLVSEDVIHSFWVPKLAGKQDVVPGRTNHMTIEASHPGRYLGQCTEYCGLSHANMKLVVVAESQESFDQWVVAQKAPPATPSDPLAAQGRELFLEGGFAGGPPCATCHTISGLSQGVVGPNLTHFSGRSVFAGAMLDRTPENLARWLRNPPRIKPGSRMPDLGLTENQIAALVAYLDALR